jgi:hypothetical protein
MLPLFVPRKPPRRRARRALAPSSPIPPGTVTVIDVEPFSWTEIIWYFSADLDGDLPANVPQLEAMDTHGSGWVSATGISLVDSNAIIAGYAGVTFDAAVRWRVISPPVGLTFSGGQVLLVPEEG